MTSAMDDTNGKRSKKTKKGDKPQTTSSASKKKKADRSSKWATAESPEGETYYYNTKTGEVSWDKPVEDTMEPKLLASPPTTQARNSQGASESNSKPLTHRDTGDPTLKKIDTGDIKRTEPGALAVSYDSSRRSSAERKKMQDNSKTSNNKRRTKSVWSEAQSPEGETYYYHKETGETTWDAPADYIEEKPSPELKPEPAAVVPPTSGNTRQVLLPVGMPAGSQALVSPVGKPSMMSRGATTGSLPVSKRSVAEARKMAQNTRHSVSAIPMSSSAGAFPASRQSYAEGRKMATVSAPVMFESGASSGRQSSSKGVRRSSSATKGMPSATKSTPRRSSSIEEQSRAHNERRKSRGHDSTTNNSDRDMDVEVPSSPAGHQSRKARRVATRRRSSKAPQVGAFPQEASQELQIPVYEQNEPVDKSESKSETDSPMVPSLFEDEREEEEADDSPMLLEAKIVEEPTLVHAEPMRKGDPESLEAAYDKPNPNRGRPVVVAAVGSCVLIILIIILVTVGRSKPDKSDSGGFEVDVEKASFLPDYSLQAIQKDNASPQSQALQWVQQHPEFEVMPDWRKQQLMALCTLYYAADGDRWQLQLEGSKQWLDPKTHECQWGLELFNDFIDDEHSDSEDFEYEDFDYEDYQVVQEAYQLLNFNYENSEFSFCSGQKTFEALFLPGQDLRGTLPPQIALLTDLKSIHLGDNQLTGILPSELGLLTNLLVLLFPENNIAGSLPTQLGELRALERLEIGSNQLTGRLYSEIFQLTNLGSLLLGSNKLSGTIPNGISRLTNLSALGIEDNSFSGSLPSELWQISSLKLFVLASNKLTGSLPASIAQLSHMTTLVTSHNNMTGPLPSELGKLTALEYLDLSHNDFSGSLPSELGQMSMLWELSVEKSQLTGPLPSQLGRLNKLLALAVHENDLTGSIPTEVGRLRNLYRFDAWSNELQGPLPSELGKLAALNYLDLSYNQLSSTLPSEIGQAHGLQHLILRSNTLDGALPSELGQLPQLENLEMSENKLSSTVPPELAEAESLVWIAVGHNSLVGSIPPVFCGLPELYTIIIDCEDMMCSCYQQCACFGDFDY